MGHEPAWDHLLASLNIWAAARPVAGGIEVSFVGRDGAPRAVELVMTPEDWEEMAGVIGCETVDSLRQRLLGLEAGAAFLVSDMGVALVPSTTRELPADSSDDVVPEPGGGWVVTDDAGHVRSRYADWREGDR